MLRITKVTLIRPEDQPLALKSLSKKHKKILKDLTHRMKRDALAKDCTGFTNPNEKNIVLMGDPDEYTTVKGHVTDDHLADFDYHHGEGAKFILVNIGRGMYKKLSLKAYEKLSKILYMTVRVKATVLTDGDGENDNDYETVMDDTYNVASLNYLFGIIPRIEGVIDGRSAFQRSQEGWNTINETDITVKILNKSGSVEVHTLHKFLDKYKLFY
jgi:hypothetical protein